VLLFVAQPSFSAATLLVSASFVKAFRGGKGHEEVCGTPPYRAQRRAP
jgi:hypothetical protein